MTSPICKILKTSLIESKRIDVSYFTTIVLGYREAEEVEESAMTQTRPSQVFRQKREIIRFLVAQYRVTNPRIYGSVLTGKDTMQSDLDVLVDPLPETTLLDLGGLQEALEEALAIRVDVKTPRDLPEHIRDDVLRQAQRI